MSFKIDSFATLRISSPDVAKSRDWYRRFFNQAPVVDIKDFASFEIGGIHFDISLADAKSPSSPGGSVGYWLIDDMEDLLRRVQDVGAKIYRGPLKISETQRTILQIQDPFGNVIGFESPYQ
jgi:predicted enzyme related to lactoylglutathione lyase